VEQALAKFADTTRQDWLLNILATSELHGKLAQAYLALGDEERALQATKRFVEVARNAERTAQSGRAAPGTPAPKRTEAGANPLPAKLIISVPKTLLDQVGNGKISFAEFKKGAAVEYLPLAAAEGSGAGPAKP